MLESACRSHYVSRDNVRLHYVVAGCGPTLVLIHGIPDFWNGWRYQIDHFKTKYQVVSVDLRGVNLSDKPSAVSAYRMIELVRDVIAVLDDLRIPRASIVGHDWGAIICWWVSILAPGRIENMAALAAPHPACYMTARENGDIHYPEHHLTQLVTAAVGDPIDVIELSRWVTDATARERLAAALRRSDAECLRNFYRANLDVPSAKLLQLPPVKVPVLAMYGMADPFVGADAYRRSAAYVRGSFRLTPIAAAGHFIHQEAPERVNLELQSWLESRQTSYP